MSPFSTGCRNSKIIPSTISLKVCSTSFRSLKQKHLNTNDWIDLKNYLHLYFWWYAQLGVIFNFWLRTACPKGCSKSICKIKRYHLTVTWNRQDRFLIWLTIVISCRQIANIIYYIFTINNSTGILNKKEFKHQTKLWQINLTVFEAS